MRIKYLSILFLMILLGGCGSTESNSSKPMIIVSIQPLQYFVDKIGGDIVQTGVLMPPSASHESYDPTPAQLAGIAKAMAYVTTGNTGMDNQWIPAFKEQNAKLKIVDLSEGIDLIEGSCSHHEGSHHEGSQHEDGLNEEHNHEGGADPHFWVSPSRALQIAESVTTMLIEFVPEKKADFEKNLMTLKKEIQQIDTLARVSFAPYLGKSFMIFHPALTYLAADYGLHQISIEKDGKEPGAEGLRKVIDLARSEKIGVILVQNQFDTNNAKTIAKETGANIKTIDPMMYDWVKSMTFLITTLAESFNKGDYAD